MAWPRPWWMTAKTDGGVAPRAPPARRCSEEGARAPGVPFPGTARREVAPVVDGDDDL